MLFAASTAAEHEEDRADRDRAEPEVGEAERPEHRERPEEQRREHDEPEAAEHAPVAERVAEHARAAGAPAGALGRNGGGPADERERRDADDAERPAGSGNRCDAAEHRPGERAEDRGGECAPDQRAAPLGRGRRDEPGERAGPGEGARRAPARSARCRAARRCRRSRTARCRARPRSVPRSRRLDADAGGDDPARDRADDHTRRVRRSEHPGAGLAQVQRVRVVGQQRRQRCEEERVEEDDGARQEEKSPDGSRRLARRLFVYPGGSMSAVPLRVTDVATALAVPRTNLIPRAATRLRRGCCLAGSRGSSSTLTSSIAASRSSIATACFVSIMLQLQQSARTWPSRTRGAQPSNRVLLEREAARS